MKIGVCGCSHTSYLFGNPWHYYMGLKLNAKIVHSSSPGAGNEMNVEKIKDILENNPDLDLFVLQVTDPGRLVMGMTNFNNENPIKIEEQKLNDGCNYRDLFFYTFNSFNNDNNLNRIIHKDFSVDNFIIPHVLTSEYNQKYKVFHTLLTIKQLCDFLIKK